VTDPSASSLHVVVRIESDTATVALAGEFDLDSAPQFAVGANEAANHSAPTVVIDLAQLTFIDSTGVAALLELHHRLSAAGRALRVVNVGQQPASVFAMTGLTGSALDIVERGA
jgi:anti-sigma B factor antagonist